MHQRASTSLPIRVLEGFETGQLKMVRPAGLEPATPCLEGRCSIRLS